jgi:deoxyribonuclease V
LKLDEIFEFTDREHAVEFQRASASRVVSTDNPDFNPRLICGMDVSYDAETAYAAAVVWDNKQEIFVEKLAEKDNAPLKYVPGLLGFREGPILFRISRMLRTIPDVFFVDGQGVAHPRGFGLACQFGLATEKPTVGVAKSLLYGRVEDDLILDLSSNKIGRVISSASGKKFYVSVGHKVSLETASRLVNDSLVDGHPAPLRQAHLISERSRRSGLG